MGVMSLVDTGAQATLMKTDGYEKYFSQIPLQKVQMTFTGYNGGAESHAKGMLETEVTIGDRKRTIRIFVIDGLQAPLLFGDDALRAFGLVLDYEKGQITMGGKQVTSYSRPPKGAGQNQAGRTAKQAAVTLEPIAICRVEVGISIQAGISKYVKCKLTRDVPDGTEVAVQPKGNPTREADLLAPRALVVVDKGSVLVPFHNMSEKTIRMRRGRKIGEANECEVLTTVVTQDAAQEACDKLNLYEPLDNPRTEEPEPKEEVVTEKQKKRAVQLQEFQRWITGQMLRKKGEVEIPEGINLESVELQKEFKEYLRILLNEYDDVFMKPGEILEGTTLVEHQIPLKDEKPLKQPYRNPLAHRKIISDEVADMLEKGIIRPSTSPWASPVVLVRKKDGTIRFCVDYRGLNAVTEKDSFPLPRIDDTLATLKGAIFFTTLDFSQDTGRSPWQ